MLFEKLESTALAETPPPPLFTKKVKKGLLQRVLGGRDVGLPPALYFRIFGTARQSAAGGMLLTVQTPRAINLGNVMAPLFGKDLAQRKITAVVKQVMAAASTSSAVVMPNSGEEARQIEGAACLDFVLDSDGAAHCLGKLSLQIDGVGIGQSGLQGALYLEPGAAGMGLHEHKLASFAIESGRRLKSGVVDGSEGNTSAVTEWVPLVKSPGTLHLILTQIHVGKKIKLLVDVRGGVLVDEGGEIPDPYVVGGTARQSCRQPVHHSFQPQGGPSSVIPRYLSAGMA
jgi:hypothetical protein